MNDDHVILYRQGSEDGSSPAKKPFWVEAYCSCGWESNPHLSEDSLADQIGNHLYEVWLSMREEPV